MKAHEDHLAWPELELHLQTLRRAADSSDVAAIKAVLRACVQGYGAASTPALSQGERVLNSPAGNADRQVATSP